MTQLLILLTYACLEPLRRITSALLYPFVYPLKSLLRDRVILWPDYLYEPSPLWPLWLLLDDSVLLEFGKEYGDRAKYYPGWIWAAGSDFLKAYWWAAIRNSCVNWRNLDAYLLGGYQGELRRVGSGRNFYCVRQFKHGKRPYCEFWTFGRRNQIGFVRGGKFEIDILKRK
jgi:hypothetical protein